MSHLKISVPQPCPQKWDKMTPAQGGRFCNQCDKVIVDFTKMSDDELLHYFSKNCNTEICGLFSNTQIEQNTNKRLALLARLQLRIENIKVKPIQRFSMFLLAFSMTIMGCRRTLGIAACDIKYGKENVKMINQKSGQVSQDTIGIK